VLELDDGSVIGVKVKAATSFSARQFRGLAKLRDQVGERFVASFVLSIGRRH
jgi:hypothetical protein